MKACSGLLVQIAFDWNSINKSIFAAKMHNEHASKGKGILDREEAVVNASLSDSDISNRKKLILGEAKKAWEVGKRSVCGLIVTLCGYGYCGVALTWDDRRGCGELSDRRSLRSIANKIVFQWEPSPFEWMNFYVADVVMEDEVGCGGVLSDEKRVACALFFGLIEVTDLRVHQRYQSFYNPCDGRRWCLDAITERGWWHAAGNLQNIRGDGSFRAKIETKFQEFKDEFRGDLQALLVIFEVGGPSLNNILRLKEHQNLARFA
ncbi:hypothetical protein Golob_000064 [Gossypium lobatum]|uniref:Uncharacterized protein n=1 Tax=Gossypium lobatum TaxID=34289 RepID=A0A7J8NKD5_9ROSI|nr:hypothetical protein [Gossypium lobatum]